MLGWSGIGWNVGYEMLPPCSLRSPPRSLEKAVLRDEDDMTGSTDMDGDFPVLSATEQLLQGINRLLLVAERRLGKTIKKGSLARGLDISLSSLYAYLDGTTLPPADKFDDLLHALGASGLEHRQLSTLRDQVEIERKVNRKAIASRLGGDAKIRSETPAVITTHAGVFTSRSFQASLVSGTVLLTIHSMPVDFLSDIDVLVSSENTYLEMDKTFKSTFSGNIRRLSAGRSPAGEIIDEPVLNELTAWLKRYARLGLPVAPATVVPTCSGQLANKGIKRIYHAAVGAPLSNTNTYRVNPDDVIQAVRNVIQLSRRENASQDARLKSVCFPLLGAGHGGLASAASVASIWTGLNLELAYDDRFEIHLIRQRAEGAYQVYEILRVIHVAK